MKKFSSMLALGLALAVTLGMTVSAAPSVSTANSSVTEDTLEADASNVRVSAPSGVEVSVSAPSVAAYDGAVGQTAQVSVATEAKNVANIKSDVILTVRKVYEVSLTSGSLGEGKSLSFTDSSFNANKTYVALHLRSSDGKWEVLPTTVSGNTISVTLTSLSPIAFVEVASVSATSPKTGEAFSAALWLAIFCAVGASLCAVKACGRKQ